MTTLKNCQLDTTDFEHDYFNSEKHSDANTEEYVRHNMSIYNEVAGLDAVYQNGLSFYHGHYALPSTAVELSADGGTSPKLMKINDLTAADFENGQCASHLRELVGYLGLSSLAELRNLHTTLMANNMRAQTYADQLEIEPVFVEGD